MELPVEAPAPPEERDPLADGITAADPGAPFDGGLPPEGGTIEGTRFAHASEAEMARILDFYAVRWEYEPTTFPILWNLDGDVVESFAPDFYLPDLDLFLEMTTLKQRLVRKKNRKLRRLRELYPDIRIKLFYARDFRAMMLKYGRLGLAHSLSGTLGQVTSERAPIVPPIAAVEIVEDVVADPVAVDGNVANAAAVVDALVVEPSPAVNADRTLVPAGSRATPRTRPGRRRRRPGKPMESGAEREAGT
ncbi:MAG TPA: hypothetical protein VMQ65_01285 [Candidatus Limnocylindria bacterium]|nr:hypothetical protein [Candidatus Limnocylindria bacterium]